MAFPRRYLNDNEEILLDLKPHIWYLAKSAIAIVVAVIGGGVIAQKANPGNGSLNGWISWLMFFLVVAAVLYFASQFAKWWTTNFVITTDRLVYRSGVIAKRGKEIPLERINDIGSSQSIIERIIGTGDLLIESGGEQGQQRFSDIRRPFNIKNEIYRAIEGAQAKDADRMAGRRQLSEVEQLEKLDDLRQRGVISQAEFDAKKAQLLERM